MTPIQAMVATAELATLEKIWVRHIRPVMARFDAAIVENMDAAIKEQNLERVRELWIFIPEDILGPRWNTPPKNGHHVQI